MEPKIVFKVTQGTLSGEEFAFTERDTCIVGRAADCRPRIPGDKEHRTISRYHCMLDVNPPDITIRDFGSRNGTFVNGSKIGQRKKGMSPEEGRQLQFPEHELKDGDQVRIGTTVFQVWIAPPPTAIHAAPVIDVASADFELCFRRLLDLAQSGQADLVAIRGYSVERQLGKGGFGAVYLARHNDTGQQVALKVLLPKVALSHRAKEQFELEAHNTRSLKHENIVSLYEFGCSEGIFFLTLEFCNGGSVDDLIDARGGRLSVDESSEIIFQVLDALAYAHQADVRVTLKSGIVAGAMGLVHRDIKPHNIFLKTSGQNRIAKLADYGLAKAFDSAGLSGRTRTGTVAGTPSFMPRQQVINFKYSKPPVDLWAVAASFYNMLTGHVPRDFVRGKDPWQIVLNSEPVPIRDRNPAVPDRLADVLDFALQDRHDLHFQTAAELKQALEFAL